MDANVIAAMARWPDVPDVYGWLSLSESGRWRLHPRGDALLDPAAAGEEISSPQILQFIGRNYTSDERGRWYFQNGPQRVYARLDAAPYIFSCAGPGPELRTHNDLPAGPVLAWWLDDTGRLYARCRQGPGLIAGRDLMGVMDGLYTEAGTPLLQALEQDDAGTQQPLLVRAMAEISGRAAAGDARPVPGNAGRGINAADPVPLHRCAARDIPAALGFEPLPRPSPN
ncbi:DUF2946 family protein [Candidimonas nitroreducens]|uniref:DUF2946 domain-containing protein n=1 Tax=Candidimonas nitroreducens TaxID=683354 RepID=A0A225MQL2_9BURK|nr:DUF2946 family protein [Candidimonas nitroreducens]OWT61731.1 hypothetical protein CEY11_07760 [Candidimonas nitroreducens]